MRRKARNSLLWFVYILIVFSMCSVMFYTQSLQSTAKRLLVHAPEMTVQSVRMGRHELIHKRFIAEFDAIRGVQSAHGRLWGYFFDGYYEGSTNYTLMVPTAPNAHHDIEPGEVIVGEGVARGRKLRVGKDFYLLPPAGELMSFRVKSILTTDTSIVSTDLVLLSEQDFRQFFDLPPDVYTDIALDVRNIRELDTIMDKGIAILPHGRFITRDDILRLYDSIFSWRQSLLLTFLLTSSLAFCILVFDKAAGATVEEKQEIGIIKAIGWDTGDVLRMKLWEGFLISTTAFAVGCTLAYLHIFFGHASLIEPIVKGWAYIYPDYQLTPEFDGFQLALMGLLSVLPYTAATLIPIWRTATADPDEVMR